MSEQEQKLAQLNAEKNDLENTHPMAAKLLQDGKDGVTLIVRFIKMAAVIESGRSERFSITNTFIDKRQ